MAVSRGGEGASLQELIDTYNTELMRYHAQTGGGGTAAPPRSTIALDTERTVQAAPPQTPQAEPSSAPARQTDEERWLRELAEGLIELQEGMRELEAGMRELNEGLRELREGERELAAGREEADTGNAGNADDPGDAPMYSEPPEDPGHADAADGGYLQVAVASARQARIEPGAQVTVTHIVDGERILYADARTDANGRTPPIFLPAYSPAAQEAAGGTALEPVPAQYSVSVYADGYAPQEDLPAEIYPGVNATLTVELIPERQTTAEQTAYADYEGYEGGEL